MKNKNLFDVGLDVWSVAYGWGKVQIIERGGIADYYPVEVLYKNSEVVCYSLDGIEMKGENRTLFFEEVAIPKSALERPRKTAKELLEECEEAEYDYEKLNYRLVRTNDGGIISDGDTTHMIIGVKYISFKDAVRIIEECRENHKEE